MTENSVAGTTSITKVGLRSTHPADFTETTYKQGVLGWQRSAAASYADLYTNIIKRNNYFYLLHIHIVGALWCSGLCSRFVISEGRGFESHSVRMPLDKAFCPHLFLSTQV